MSKTSFVGFIRQYGSTKKATPSVSLQVTQLELIASAAVAATGKKLPKGAIVQSVSNVNGGATGAGTLDIGTSVDSQLFADELAADSVNSAPVTSAQAGVALTADTEIFAGAGDTVAPGGIVKIAVYFFMEDDGKA